MQFKPLTKEEANTRKLWPAGEYDFEIVKGEDYISKAGNNMIKLVLKVFNQDGEYIMLSDYLSHDENFAFKFRHCCEAIGITEKYESGDLVPDDFVTGTGKLKLRIQKGKKKDASDTSPDAEKYDDSNSVGDYIEADTRTVEQKKASDKNHGIKKGPASELDDTVPFSFAIACFASIMMAF